MTARLDWERDGRDWPHRDASRFVSAGDLVWHVQIMGTGPPLLLLHGTGASTHSLRKIMPLLAARFTVIAPDLPGHGFTSMPATDAGLSLPGMAAGIGALTRTIGFAPSAVAGHSAGAAILIRATLDGEIRPHSIVSINGALLPFGSSMGRLFAPIARIMAQTPLVHHAMAWRAKSPAAVAHLLRGTGSEPTAEDVALYGRLFNSPRHVRAALGMMANWDLESLGRDLHRLAAELVLVAGQNDRAIPPLDAERIARRVTSARILRLAGAGHLAHEEQPQAVADIIAATAQRAAGPAAPPLMSKKA